MQPIETSSNFSASNGLRLVSSNRAHDPVLSIALPLEPSWLRVNAANPVTGAAAPPEDLRSSDAFLTMLAHASDRARAAGHPIGSDVTRHLDNAKTFREQVLHLRETGRAQPPIRGGLASWQVAKAKQLLAGDPISASSIDKSADACSVSRAYFSRAFKQSTGWSPHQWRINERIGKAKSRMMDAAGPLAEIALQCGFSGQGDLSRQFGKSTGITPGLWRRTFRATVDTDTAIVVMSDAPRADEPASVRHLHLQLPIKRPGQKPETESSDTLTRLLYEWLVAYNRQQTGHAPACVQQVAMALYAHLSTGDSLNGSGSLLPWQLARAKELLSAQTQGSVSVGRVAQACKMGRASFSAAFKETTGVLPSRWRLQHRISLAKAFLVAGNMTMVNIANECGFSEQSHFNHTFMDVVGKSPGGWQREQKKAQALG